ncbi:MAG: ATP-binding protein [Alphaproteobacteria bacterium]|nr:ATP-binding protein [Alphaproteobacteria bacterium]
MLDQDLHAPPAHATEHDHHTRLVAENTQIWRRICTTLRGELGEQTFNRWLGGVEVMTPQTASRTDADRVGDADLGRPGDADADRAGDADLGRTGDADLGRTGDSGAFPDASDTHDARHDDPDAETICLIANSDEQVDMMQTGLHQRLLVLWKQHRLTTIRVTYAVDWQHDQANASLSDSGHAHRQGGASQLRAPMGHIPLYRTAEDSLFPHQARGRTQPTTRRAPRALSKPHDLPDTPDASDTQVTSATSSPPRTHESPSPPRTHESPSPPPRRGHATPPTPPTRESARTRTRERTSVPRGAMAQPIARKRNRALTFDTFLEDTSNRLALRAMQRLVTMGEAGGCFVLHGQAGVGKTHLLHALCNAVIEQDDPPAALMLTSEDFVADFVHAVRRGRTAKDLQQFKSFFRSRELLLIDDFHFLANKPGSQAEIARILDDLQDATVVVTADAWPGEWVGFIDPLQSRLMNALHLRIDPPDDAFRHRILSYKATAHGVHLRDDVALFLASRIKDSPRVLEGAIRRLAAYESLLGEKVTLDNVMQIFREYAKKMPHQLRIDDIQRKVADHF